MSTFDLQSFIADPTLEIFDRCRKDDLLQIAEYYRIPVVRQSLKHIIKNEIWKHLVELKVFLFPDADSERAGMSAVEKRLTSVGNVVEAEDENAEVEVEAEPKTGLLPFYPLSPLSVGSGGDARPRVRLAKIQMEAQERAETRQAEIKLRLEKTFEDLLTFMTSADAVLPLGFPKKAEIDFYTQEDGYRRLPYESTCSMVLFLPRGLLDESDLQNLLTAAVKGSIGLGKKLDLV